MRLLNKSRLRHHHQRESGQSMIETALMIVVVLMLVFWIFEISMLIYTYTVLGDAANEGVRYAALLHNSSNSAVVTDDSRVKAKVLLYAQASLHDMSAISTSVTLPDGDATPPNRVRISVTYTYVPYLSKFLP